MKHNFKVEKSGIRLDKFISENLLGCSRQLARKACATRMVLLNGRPSKAGAILSVGDSVVVEDQFLLTEASAEHWSEVDDLPILYDDDSLVCVLKPAGMHSVRLQADDPPTVADFLALRFPETREASADSRESGLVQRLDYWTTGALLAAKSSEAHRELAEQMKSGALTKTYLALVEGKLKAKRVSSCWLEAKPGAKQVRCHEQDPGREFVWPVRLSLEPYATSPQADFSVVRVSLHSAKRHQVRAQLAFEGLKLVGDDQYGADNTLSDLSISREGFMLFAESIALAHPSSTKHLFIKADSQEFEKLIALWKTGAN